MDRYNFPASKHMNRYAPFEPNSHYYVRGSCVYKGKRYPCDFEIAYTLQGNIYAIPYFKRFDDYHAVFAVRADDMPWNMYFTKQESVVVKLYGIDLRTGLQVIVDKALSIEHGDVFLHNSPTVLIADTFTLNNIDEIRVEQEVEHRSYINFELLNVLGFDRKRIQFDIGHAEAAVLEFAFPEEQQTAGKNSVLSIHRSSVPIGWSAEDVANLWCACISFSLGLDIRWIVKQTHTTKMISHKFKQRRNIVRQLKTEGVIGTRGDFWNDPSIHQFVKQVFSTARTKRFSAQSIRDYARIMWQFVEYRLITTRAEDQARLISTTIEELVTTWETHTKRHPIPVLTIEEGVEIWSKTESIFIDQVDTVLGGLTKQRKEQIGNRLRVFFQKDAAMPGFEKRLRHMLSQGTNNSSWVKAHAQKRLSKFVDTRNKIAHTGKFPSNKSVELFDYYFNMLMVLPILVFSLFGYDGEYHDLAAQYRQFQKRKANEDDFIDMD